MTYRDFKDGIKLSRLGLGCMRLPTVGDDPSALIDRARANEIVDYAIAHGINYFDTAYIYHGGDSEKFLGEALNRYPRDKWYVADKYNTMSGPDFKGIFEEQLERLKTDHIDFYLLHGVTDLKADEYINSGCIDFFREQKEKGRIRYFGFSSHATPKALERMIEYGKGQWDLVQIQLNYFDWAHGTARGQYELLEKNGIPVMVMEPIRGGKLMSVIDDASKAELAKELPGASLAEWALRWVMRLGGVQVVLSGMSTLEQIVENVATFEKDEPLNDAQCELLGKAADAYRSSIAVPCTGCRYCVDGCPQELDIPELLGIYNSFKVNGPFGLGGLDVLAEDKTPKNCIACGTCTDRCPQLLEIPKYLEELAQAATFRL